MLPSPGAETTPVFFSIQYSYSCPPVRGRSSLPSPLYISSPGFLITGGLPNTKVVELMVPSLDRRCILPELPGPRVGHGQVGEVVCGGLELLPGL